jgi:hypothetical protein
VVSAINGDIGDIKKHGKKSPNAANHWWIGDDEVELLLRQVASKAIRQDPGCLRQIPPSGL